VNSSTNPTKKLLAIASHGGHWIELARLSPAFATFDTLYVTTSQGVAAPSGHRPVHAVRDASRSDPLGLLLLGSQLVKLLMRFRPDVIVTTGAAPGLLALALGKLVGCRTVWIDSIANAETLSLSGKLAKRCADARLTQWPDLADEKDGLICLGRVV
jgi:hypothetical protein